jgi:radical SAM protein with 4Fe4S-binding SPASM domain
MDVGVDVFRCIPVGLPFDAPDAEALAQKWFPVAARDDGVEMSSNEKASSSCYFLYRYLVVNPDGKASPCCVVSGEKNDFGDFAGEGLDGLWNNSRYRSARALYRTKGVVAEPVVCERCDLFAKRSSRPGAAPAAAPPAGWSAVAVVRDAARTEDH